MAGILKIRYKNYRGEISNRNLVPLRVYWGNTEYHPENQWLMEAVDITDPISPKVRDFAIADFNPPSKDQDGYVEAFYEMTKMMGFNTPMGISPKDAFERHIRPQLAWLIEHSSGSSIPTPTDPSTPTG